MVKKRLAKRSNTIGSAHAYLRGCGGFSVSHSKEPKKQKAAREPMKIESIQSVYLEVAMKYNSLLALHVTTSKHFS